MQPGVASFHGSLMDFTPGPPLVNDAFVLIATGLPVRMLLQMPVLEAEHYMD